MSNHDGPDRSFIEPSLPNVKSMTELLQQCDNLLDQASVRESRIRFMEKAINAYHQAAVLLGYFSQLIDFQSELQQLSSRMTIRRIKILSTYVDILPGEVVKELSMPPMMTKHYQKGVHKFRRIRNYIIFHYRQKLYDQLESEPKKIGTIREIMLAIANLDKHYDIYEELVVDLQKKNKEFERIMQRHLPEFIFI